MRRLASVEFFLSAPVLRPVSVPLHTEQFANSCVRLDSASLGRWSEEPPYSELGSGVIKMLTPQPTIHQSNRRVKQSNSGGILGPSVGEPKISIIQRAYFTSTVAPASVNFFLMLSASSLVTPSFTVFGAPSTRSFASFKPRLVTSRTALITLILLAPTAVRTTANSVFSSAGAAPAAAPPPAATITGAAAAADTPSRSSNF